MNRWDTLIRSAIAVQQVLVLRYEGWTSDRAIEPHTYGRDAKGDDLIRAWQESGGSASGERIGWKLFKTSKIVSMSLSAGTFTGTRAGYKRGDPSMQTIYAEL